MIFRIIFAIARTQFALTSSFVGMSTGGSLSFVIGMASASSCRLGYPSFPTCSSRLMQQGPSVLELCDVPNGVSVPGRSLPTIHRVYGDSAYRSSSVSLGGGSNTYATTVVWWMPSRQGRRPHLLSCICFAASHGRSRSRSRFSVTPQVGPILLLTPCLVFAFRSSTASPPTWTTNPRRFHTSSSSV